MLKKLRREFGRDAAASSKRISVDSTVVRAHQLAAGAKVTAANRLTGPSHGTMGTRVHAIACDAKTALAVKLKPGQARDAPAFEATEMELPEETSATALVADRR